MAAFFWIHAGANNNVGTVNNWSATSGGGTNAATPSVTSDVTYDGAGANGNDASTVAANVSFLSLTFTTGYTNTVTINTATTLTIAGNFTDKTNHSWTVNGTGAMTISAASTITSGGKTFPGPVSFSNSNTKTLVGDWTITGTLTCVSTTTTINHTTAENLSCAGLTVTGATTGNCLVTITGGIWSGAGANTLTSLTIAGNVTISGSNVLYSTGTLKYSSGTVTTTSSTITVGASTTFDTNGISFNNITLTASTITLTINSLLTITGTFTNSSNTTFAGTAAFSIATFACNQTSANTITFKNSLTYTITTAFNAFNSRTASILLFTSDDGTLKANLTLNNGATCNVLASFTRIDASGGRPILSFNGTITTCINVFAYSDVPVYPPALKRVMGRRKQLYNRAKTVQYE